MKRATQVNPSQVPMFTPEFTWSPPDSYPDLSREKEISIDLETKDPHLTELGAGWARGDGHVIGVSVATADRQWYFPIRHAHGPNMDPKMTMRWLQEQMRGKRNLIFHNSPYDIGWLGTEGVTVPSDVGIVDTQVVGALLDEHRYSYSLDNLSKDYLGRQKNETAMREAAAIYGVADVKSGMWMLPSRAVGLYAEQDARLPFDLWQRFQPLIAEQDLHQVMSLEFRVLRALVPMRKRGIRVDLERAHETKKFLQRRCEELLAQVHAQTGVHAQAWAAESLAKVFDALKLPYSKTPTGMPSFTKAFLEHHQHPVAQMLVAVRRYDKAIQFVDSLFRYQVNGRVHTELHPLRSDEGGTVTGRFSCSNPNLQQIPARDPEIGPLMRRLYLPEEGETWAAMDYSNQEPRLVAHFAYLLKLPGAVAFWQKYQEDPRTDFHQLAADIVGVSRKHAKNINLGLFYGMGKAKLAAQLGMDDGAADELFVIYHQRLPFVKALSDSASNRAKERGFIRTLLGRRCRYEQWEPSEYGKGGRALDRLAALEAYGPAIRRAFTHKALNSLIQGSAADQTKMALVMAYEAGELPLLQVHDELAFSVTSEEQCRKIMDIMENCVQLAIPSLVDAELGPSWGEAKQSPEEYSF